MNSIEITVTGDTFPPPTKPITFKGLCRTCGRTYETAFEERPRNWWCSHGADGRAATEFVWTPARHDTKDQP